MSLDQTIELAIKKVAKKMQFAQVVSGVAKNITETTCELHRENAPVIFDVRLNAIDDDLQSYVTVYPKSETDVLVGIIEGQKTEAVVLRCSEVERVKYKISDQTMIISSEGVVFNNGTNGLVKIEQLTNIDENGKAICFETENFPARVIQHEVDHLNGILFIDKAKKLRQAEKTM